MKFKLIVAAVFITALGLLFSCGSKENKEKKNLIMVFLPNESNNAMKDARLAFKELLEEATGLTVEIKTTTDYNIALEAIISGKADMAYIGAEGYINAHKKNPHVIPLTTNSGPSGTLEDAKYYSLIAVRTEDESLYKTETGYDLNKLQGKVISFVTPSSTSGFTIPASLIASRFGIANTDELIQNKEVFADVLFAGTHQGSQINLFRKDADAAVFAMAQTLGIYDLTAGTRYQTGSRYKVVENAVDPFKEFPGAELVIIQSIPVLNAPIVINSENVSEEYQKKIQDALTSEKAANMPGIFKIEGSDKQGLYPKYTDKTKLIKTDDAWYDEIRNLTK